MDQKTPTEHRNIWEKLDAGLEINKEALGFIFSKYKQNLKIWWIVLRQKLFRR